MAQNFEKEIERLNGLDLEGLRKEWKEGFGEDPPAGLRADLLRRLLILRVQEQHTGGPAPQITQIFEGDPSDALSLLLQLKPGAILTREWEGIVHEVKVLEEGFEYAGERYASLSEVARKIIGTDQPGPRFFGLGL